MLVQKTIFAVSFAGIFSFKILFTVALIWTNACPLGHIFAEMAILLSLILLFGSRVAFANFGEEQN